MIQSEFSAGAILWDVVEEHLAEADFTFAQRERALRSPTVALPEFADGIEKRLLAHVDGLVVGGAAVRKRLLDPALADVDGAERSKLAVALLALLAQRDFHVAADALLSDWPELSAAAEEALALAGSPHLPPWLPRALAATSDGQRRSRLLRVAARLAIDPGNIRASLQSADEDELAAAATAATWADSTHLPVLGRLTDHPMARVRDAALVAALCHQSGHAWRRCLLRAAAGGSTEAVPMLMVALLGEPQHHHLLLQGRPSVAAATALGYSGTAEIAERILAWIGSGSLPAAKAAASAFSIITGLDITQAPFALTERATEPESLPALEDDDLNADLTALAAEETPPPNPEAIARWWKGNRGRFSPGHRFLWGLPWTGEGAAEFLLRAPLGRRAPVALWVTLHANRAARVDTRAFSSRQRAQIEVVRTECGALTHAVFPRGERGASSTPPAF